MSKRPADGAGGSDKKKRYVQGHGAGAHDLGPGICGALVTCDVHLEREAIKEAYRLFDAQLDDAAPQATAEEDDAKADVASTGGTAADALAAELKALQGEASKDAQAAKKHVPRLSIAQTGCNGTVFVRVASSAPLAPLALVDRVMERAQANAAGSKAPHVVRMLPVQATCSARSASSIAEAATPLLAAALTGYTGSYAVVWRRRCNNELDKMSVINGLAAAMQQVAPRATVDLNGAEAAIVAEVIKTTCCLAVLPRWKEFHGYNLRTVSGGSAGDGSGGSKSEAASSAKAPPSIAPAKVGNKEAARKSE